MAQQGVVHLLRSCFKRKCGGFCDYMTIQSKEVFVDKIFVTWERRFFALHNKWMTPKISMYLYFYNINKD